LSVFCCGSMVQGLRVGLVFSFVYEVLLQCEEHKKCFQRFVISCGLWALDCR